MKKTEPHIIVEQDFKVNRDQLWSAITDPEEMRQWFFPQMPDFKSEKGFYTDFLITNEGREFTHQWTVVEVIPLEKITVRWQFLEYPGDSHVVFHVSENAGGSHLRLSVVVLEDFQDDVPEFRRESAVGGWNYFIGENLPAYFQ
jgi:uncharacterized protein YndB with AHSA1/START domain